MKFITHRNRIWTLGIRAEPKAGLEIEKTELGAFHNAKTPTAKILRGRPNWPAVGIALAGLQYHHYPVPRTSKRRFELNPRQTIGHLAEQVKREECKEIKFISAEVAPSQVVEPETTYAIMSLTKGMFTAPACASM